MEQSMAWGSVALPLLLAVSGGLAALPAARGDGACVDEDRGGMDFLVGEWRLVEAGEEVGRSRVEKLEGGCLIAETWSFSDGRTGRTYSSFDADAGAWQRLAVSNGGDIVRSRGTVDGGVLTFSGDHVSADGRRSNWREQLSRPADGRTVRVSRRVARGGRSSTMRFDGRYEPADAGEPRAPVDTAAEAGTPPRPTSAGAPPEPGPQPPGPGAPTAPTAGEVTPASERAADATAIERIAMASPMVLRLPLGTVESLPEGYAWSTRDTAPYLCEGVTIQRLQVERSTRRGQVELEVELAVHSSYLSRRVEIGVDLHRSGRQASADPVASDTAAGRVGRSIPAQLERGAVPIELVLAMDPTVFDEIVAAAERPELVITLTVGG